AVALLPWTWWPPFPWLHEHAQWADVVFAATAAAWMMGYVTAGQFPRFHPVFLAVGVYVGWAAVSAVVSGSLRALPKLVGIAELATIAILTADIAARPAVRRFATAIVSVSAVVLGAGAVLGEALFFLGIPTRLVGVYGDLM